jgi:threonine dehydrogenase-like Zn-dependent dehydrogenase
MESDVSHSSLDIKADRLEVAKSCGADATLLSTDPDFVNKVKQAAGGLVDAAIDWYVLPSRSPVLSPPLLYAVCLSSVSVPIMVVSANAAPMLALARSPPSALPSSPSRTEASCCWSAVAQVPT